MVLDSVNAVGCKFDAERIHVPVGLAERERVACIAEDVHPFASDLVRLDVVGTGDDRVGLELVVHERADPEAKGAGKLNEDAECGHYLALLDRIDDLFLDAGLLGEVPDAPSVVLAVHLYPLACLVFLVAHVAFRFSGPECSVIDEKADRPFPRSAFLVLLELALSIKNRPPQRICTR